MNNEILKNAVAQVIKENGNEEITGNILQQVLIAMINSFGLGFQFIGEAKPETNPGTPDARVFYFAQDAGTYSNFDGLVLDGSSVAVFFWGDSWTHLVINIPTTTGLDARYLKISDLAVNTGASTTTAMTQKAVSDALSSLASEISQLGQEIGEHNLARMQDVGGISFEQGSFNSSTGATGQSTTRIRCTAAISTKIGWIGVPDGFLIHEVYYYSAWTDNSTFTFARYVNVGKSQYFVDATQPFVRFSIRKSDNGTITPNDYLNAIQLISPSIDALKIEVRDKIQLLRLEELPGAIQVSTWDMNLGRTHYIIPVNGGDAIEFDNSANTMYCAFLKSYTTPVAGETPDFCSGYESRQQLFESSGATKLPSDCRFLCINNPNGIYTFTSLKINGVEIINGVHGAIAKVGELIKTNATNIQKSAQDIINLQNSVGNIQTALQDCIKPSDFTYIVTSNNIAFADGIVEDYLVADGGAILPSTAGWCLYKLPVTPGMILTVGGFYLGRNGYYAFYNGETLVEYHGFPDPNGITTPLTVTIPAGVTHFYFDIKSGQSPENPYKFLQINVGNSLLAYDEPTRVISEIKGEKIAGSGNVEIPDLLADLPVSDGTEISTGYAYIDSSTGVVKVKMS